MSIPGEKTIITAGEHAGKEGVFIRFRSASKTMFGIRPAYCVIFLGAEGAVQVSPDQFHTAVAEVDEAALCAYDRLYGESDEASGWPRVVTAEAAAAWRESL